MRGEVRARVRELDDREDDHQHELRRGEQAEPDEHRAQRHQHDRDEHDGNHQLEGRAVGRDPRKDGREHVVDDEGDRVRQVEEIRERPDPAVHDRGPPADGGLDEGGQPAAPRRSSPRRRARSRAGSRRPRARAARPARPSRLRRRRCPAAASAARAARRSRRPQSRRRARSGATPEAPDGDWFSSHGHQACTRAWTGSDSNPDRGPPVDQTQDFGTTRWFPNERGKRCGAG